MKQKVRKIALTLLMVGIVTALAGIGSWSAFSSTSQNDGNSFAAGTVYLSDNDAGAAMYQVSNKKPNDTVQTCIKLTYTGSLAADVHLYTTSSLGSLGQYLDLTVEKGSFAGSPAFPSCTGFSSQATIYSGTLANFASTKTSFATGVAAYPGAQTQWNQNDALVYRFTLTVQDNNAAGGLTTGSHSFIWEAQNQ